MTFMNFDTFFIVFSIFAILAGVAKLLEVNGFLLNSYAAELAETKEAGKEHHGCAVLLIMTMLLAAGVLSLVWRIVGYFSYESLAFLVGLLLQIGFFIGSCVYAFPRIKRFATDAEEIKRMRRFTAISGVVQLTVTIYALLTI